MLKGLFGKHMTERCGFKKPPQQFMEVILFLIISNCGPKHVYSILDCMSFANQLSPMPNLSARLPLLSHWNVLLLTSNQMATNLPTKRSKRRSYTYILDVQVYVPQNITALQNTSFSISLIKFIKGNMLIIIYYIYTLFLWIYISFSLNGDILMWTKIKLLLASQQIPAYSQSFWNNCEKKTRI
jgi:hypothetical protein